MSEYGDRLIEGKTGALYPIDDLDFERTIVLGGDFEVEGGIYAKNIKVQGRGVVHGPAFVRAETTLYGMHSSLAARSGVTSISSLKTDETGLPPSETTVARPGGERIISGGDLVSEHVFLENCLVVGSVQGAEKVYLKNCLVIGPVFSHGEVHMANCTFLTYNAESVVFEGRNTCILPMGFSRNRPIFADAVGPAYLRYIAICDPDAPTAFLNGSLRHNPAETHEDDQRVCVNPQADFHHGSLDSWGDGWGLNLSARALNWKPVRQSIESLGAVLKVFYEWEHYSESLRMKFIEEISRSESVPSLLREVAPAIDARFSFDAAKVADRSASMSDPVDQDLCPVEMDSTP